MKALFTILVITVFSLNSIAQLQPSHIEMTSKNTDLLLKKARKIMNKLGFCIRENTSKDGMVDFYIDPLLPGLYAGFTFRRSEVIYPSTSYNLRYYKNPIIRLSYKLDSLSANLKDTTSQARIKGESILIHEICHYLQCSDVIDNYSPIVGYPHNANDLIIAMRRYINQADEFEAWSVGSYYFLEKYDKTILKRIMKSQSTVRRKCELLINWYRYIDFPRNPLLYDPE